MTRQQLVRPIYLFAAVATLGQAPRALAIEYLSVEFSQAASALVRDYLGDPGYSDGSISRTIELPIHFPFDAQRSLGIVADVTRTGNHGYVGSAHSRSIASYQLSSITSGFASFEQTASSQGYYVDNRPAGDISVAETNAGSGPDTIKIHFRIDESDGDVVFNSRIASTGRGQVYVIRSDGYAAGGVNIHLSPGVWTIFLNTFDGVGTFSNSYPASARGQYSASWTLDGSFVGDTPDNPYVTIVDTEDSEGEPSDPPVSVSDPILTFPVPGDNGTTPIITWVAVPTQVIRGDSAGALVTGYEITSEYSRLTSFVVPDLPPGSESLTIDTGAGPQSIVAGETIDFGPEGLESFTLAGFDPMHANAELDAFVMGLHFAEAGLASLSAIPTLFIPPGDFSENGFVDGYDFLLWQRNPAIGNLSDWQANYGTPSIAVVTNVSAATVPEPQAMILIAFVSLGLIVKHRHYKRGPGQ